MLIHAGEVESEKELRKRLLRNPLRGVTGTLGGEGDGSTWKGGVQCGSLLHKQFVGKTAKLTYNIVHGPYCICVLLVSKASLVLYCISQKLYQNNLCFYIHSWNLCSPILESQPFCFRNHNFPFLQHLKSSNVSHIQGGVSSIQVGTQGRNIIQEVPVLSQLLLTF